MLDALSCRTEPSKVNGTILVDGRIPPSNFKFTTGYVVQVTMTTAMMTVVAVAAGGAGDDSHVWDAK